MWYQGLTLLVVQITSTLDRARCLLKKASSNATSRSGSVAYYAKYFYEEACEHRHIIRQKNKGTDWLHTWDTAFQRRCRQVALTSLKSHVLTSGHERSQYYLSGVALLDGIEHQHGLSIQNTVLSSLAR
jgi:hypothetical protein